MTGGAAVQHYSIGKIRRAMRFFLAGKATTAACALALLILLGRALPSEDYAAYVSLQALVLVIGIVTSFGINQSLSQYAPALRAANNNLALYHRLFTSIATRALVFGIACGVALTTAPWWAGSLQLDRLPPALLAIYLVVGWARTLELFLSGVLESVLWQKLSQTVLGATSLLKVAGASLLYEAHVLDLKALFLLELAAELLNLALLGWGLFRRWKADPLRNAGDRSWWRQNRQRVDEYARWAYLNGLSKLAQGTATNRLIAARFLPPELVAVFGFADAIGNLTKRFMPARLMHGMIRPVLIVRYSKSRDFADLNRMVNLNFRLNAVLLCAGVALLLAAGPELLRWLTKGKYGDAAYLLVGLLGVLLLDAGRAQIHLMCHILELPRLALVSNLSMLIGLVFTVMVIDQMATWAIVAGGFIAELAGIATATAGLRRAGFRLRADALMLRPVLVAAASAGIGLAISRHGSTLTSEMLAMTGTASLYVVGLFVFRPLNSDEMAMIRKLIRKNP